MILLRPVLLMLFPWWLAGAAAASAGTLEQLLASSSAPPGGVFEIVRRDPQAPGVALPWGTKLSPDLIVADLSLPVTREINIARRLKKAFPGIKLIILSIHDEGTAVGECLVVGASGFVLKRTAVNDLAPAFETVMKGDLYISPSVVQTSAKNQG